MSRKLAALLIGTNSSQQVKPFKMFEGDIRRIAVDVSAVCGLKGTTVSSATWTSDDGIDLTDDAVTGHVCSASLSATTDGVFRGKVVIALTSGETKVYLWRVVVIPTETFPPLCPVLLTPADGEFVADVVSVTVDWQPSVFATSYDVYLDGELVDTVTGTSYEFTGLEAQTAYTWSIIPIGASGGPESCATYMFTTGALACPLMYQPGDGGDVGEATSTVLAWDAVPGASSYQVFVWEDGDPQPEDPITETADLMYEVTGLSLGVTYRWLIIAANSGGSYSVGCTTFTFSTNPSDAIIEWQSATFTRDIQQSTATIVAVRTGNTTITASADYAFTQGTALIGPDIAPTDGTVTFAPGEITQNVVIPLVRDYDAEVLAGLDSGTITPWAYWPLRDTSIPTGFDDLTTNNRDVTPTNTSGLLLNQTGYLNLAASASIYWPSSGIESQIRRSWSGGGYMQGMQSIMFEGWAKFNNATDMKSLFMIGGSNGSAQVTKCECYRDPGTGRAFMYWEYAPVGGGFAGANYVDFSSVALPLNQEFYFVAGQNCGTRQAFFKLNNNAVQYVSWISDRDPWQIAGRETFICLGSSLVPGRRSQHVGGNLSHMAFYTSIPTTLPDRYPRWNLDASLTFTSQLSNPGVDTQIGTIDDTAVALEAV